MENQNLATSYAFRVSVARRDGKVIVVIDELGPGLVKRIDLPPLKSLVERYLQGALPDLDRLELWERLDSRVSDHLPGVSVNVQKRIRELLKTELIGQLVQKREAEIFGMKGIGNKSMKRIRTMLKSLGLHFAMNRDELLGWKPPVERV
jgi:hypothetical protein